MPKLYKVGWERVQEIKKKVRREEKTGVVWRRKTTFHEGE